MRKNQLEAVALTGMIEGKRARGRQRKTFMDWISANQSIYLHQTTWIHITIKEKNKEMVE